MLKKILKDENGSILVELGMFLPLLLAIVFGYISYTNAIRNDIVLQMAAREGAREYSTSHNISSAKAKAMDQLELGGIDPDEVTIESHEKINAYGEKERFIVISKPMMFHIPFIGDYDISLRRGAMFYAERQY